MKNIVTILFAFILISCNNKVEVKNLEAGRYRATLKVDDTLDLPFNFEVISKSELYIFNADEIIKVDEITYKKDSIYIKMPVFEGFMACKYENEVLNGYFVKKSLNRIVPFSAEKNDLRFYNNEAPFMDISGNWETLFSPNSETDMYEAKGIFKQDGNKVTGTFRTTTGDYRYLEGSINGDKLKLSTFDGAHAFLFTATVTDSTMKGMFYSGNHWKEPFTSRRNDAYELPNASELTYLNDGYDKLSFSFPDTDGNFVSLEDDRFKNKVVVVQIMGTWCPNCLDESKYFAEFYKTTKNKNVEIIALAFEYAKTKDNALNNIKRLKERTGITYPILLAQYGSASKVKAQEKLPMLNHVLSYPTSIFIDKKGKVRKIHTGFNGPATGEKYIAFKDEFEGFVDVLLGE